MQMFENLPWYGYVIFFVAIGSYAYRYFKVAKSGYDEPDIKKAKFIKSEQNGLTGDKLFSLSLDAVTTEWWGANTNTLGFIKGRRAKNYLEGWGIDTTEGYWALTNYFMEEGRRWYFDFIYKMINSEPEGNWENLMEQKFGNNERANRYLNLLSSGKALNSLKSKGFITFDSEIEIGVIAYDVSILVGQARRAYTAEIITEEEALKVIDFATQLARNTFSSWDEFATSYILGFTLDIRDRKDGYLEEMDDLFKQVKENPLSPWNTINW